MKYLTFLRSVYEKTHTPAGFAKVFELPSEIPDSGERTRNYELGSLICLAQNGLTKQVII